MMRVATITVHSCTLTGNCPYRSGGFTDPVCKHPEISKIKNVVTNAYWLNEKEINQIQKDGFPTFCPLQEGI